MARETLMSVPKHGATYPHPKRRRPFDGRPTPCELPERVSVVRRGSREWKQCGMDSRLEGLPHLERLIKEEKALVVLCDVESSSARDKAMILDCYSDDIVKALYANRIRGEDHYMVVCRGADQIKLKRLLARQKDVEGLLLEMCYELPPGMQCGTCTPFMPQSVADSLRMIAVEDPAFVPRSYGGAALGPIGRNYVDVGIGGTDELALKLSAHMLYSDLAASLLQAYGDRIKLLDYIHAK